MAAIIGVSNGRRLSDFQALKGYTQALAEKAEEVGTALKHLEYKDYSNGTEPLVTKDIIESSDRIGSKNQNGWYRQYAQGTESEITNRVDDVVRITKWIGTPRGVLWEAHQTALEMVQTDLNRKRRDVSRVYGKPATGNFWSKLGSSALNALKDAGTSIVDSIGLTAATLEQVAGAGTGLHTEPFITRAYLRTGSEGVLGQLLSTAGFGTSMYIHGAHHALEGTEVPVEGIEDSLPYSLKSKRKQLGTEIRTLQVKNNSKEVVNGGRKGGSDLSKRYLLDTGRVQDTFKDKRSLAVSPSPEVNLLYDGAEGKNLSRFKAMVPPVELDKNKQDFSKSRRAWYKKYLKDSSIINPDESYPLESVNLHQSAIPEGKRNNNQYNEQRSVLGDASKSRGITGDHSVGDAEAGLGTRENPAAGQVSVLGDSELQKSRYYRGSNGSKTVPESDLRVDQALHLRSGDRYHSAWNSTGKDDDYKKKLGSHAQTSVETPTKFEDRRSAGKTRNLVPFYFQIRSDYVEFEATLESYSDNYSGNWSDFQYIGRGEKFYVYENFDRTISFKFVALARNPESLKPLYHKLNRLASATAPFYHEEQNYFMNGPLSIITIGDLLQQQWGFFQSVNLSWQTDYLWEIGSEQVQGISGYENQRFIMVPHALDVDVTFKPVHMFNVDIRNADYFAVYSEKDGVGLDLLDEWNGVSTPSGQQAGGQVGQTPAGQIVRGDTTGKR